MYDLTNQPATVSELYQRFLEFRKTDPNAVACRRFAQAADPHGIVLENLDQRAWLHYLEVKRAKGLVIEEGGK
jgi:hypothetical protein